MRQKSINESMRKRDKALEVKMDDLLDIDDLLDDEGWDLLNGLSEAELEQLNNEFDPEGSILGIAADKNAKSLSNAEPMYNKEDLLDNLEKMVAESKPVIKNEKLRIKEEEKKKQKERELDEKYLKKPKQSSYIEIPSHIALTKEEEELLNEATEEELIEAAEHALAECNYELQEKILYILKQKNEKNHDSISNDASIGDDVPKNNLDYNNNYVRPLKTVGETTPELSLTTKENENPFLRETAGIVVSENKEGIGSEIWNQHTIARNKSPINVSTPKDNKKVNKKINNDERNSSKVRTLDNKTIGKKTPRKYKRRKSSVELKLERVRASKQRLEVDNTSDSFSDSDGSTSETSFSESEEYSVVAFNKRAPGNSVISPVKVNCNVFMGNEENLFNQKHSSNDICIELDIDIQLDEHFGLAQCKQNEHTDSEDTDRTVMNSDGQSKSSGQNDLNLQLNVNSDKEIKSALKEKKNIRGISRGYKSSFEYPELTPNKGLDVKVKPQNENSNEKVRRKNLTGNMVKTKNQTTSVNKVPKDLTSTHLQGTLSKNRVALMKTTMNDESEPSAKLEKLNLNSKRFLNNKDKFLNMSDKKQIHKNKVLKDKDKLSHLQNEDIDTSVQADKPICNSSFNTSRSNVNAFDDDFDSGIDRSHSRFSAHTATDVETDTLDDLENIELDSEIVNNGNNENSKEKNESSKQHSESRVRKLSNFKTYRQKSLDRTYLKKQKSVEKLNKDRQSSTKSFQKCPKCDQKIDISRASEPCHCENETVTLRRNSAHGKNRLKRLSRELKTNRFPNRASLEINEPLDTNEIPESILSTKRQKPSNSYLQSLSKLNCDKNQKNTLINEFLMNDSSDIIKKQNKVDSCIPYIKKIHPESSLSKTKDITDGKNNFTRNQNKQKDAAETRAARRGTSHKEQLELAKNETENYSAPVSSTNVDGACHEQFVEEKPDRSYRFRQGKLSRNKSMERVLAFNERFSTSDSESEMRQQILEPEQNRDNNKKSTGQKSLLLEKLKSKQTSSKSRKDRYSVQDKSKLKEPNDRNGKLSDSYTQRNRATQNQSQSKKASGNNLSQKLNLTSLDNHENSDLFTQRRKANEEREAELKENRKPFASQEDSVRPRLDINKFKFLDDHSLFDEEQVKAEELQQSNAIGFDSDYFSARRKARQRRIYDDNYIEEYKLEDKVSISQQIDLINLQKAKENAAKSDNDKKEENVKNNNIEKKTENIKKTTEEKREDSERKAERNLTSQPEKKTSFIKSPKHNVPQSKEAGLEALEAVRMKLRKVPKPEEVKQEEEVEPGVEEDVTEKRRKMIQVVEGDAKPRKSALALLLEKDAAKRENMKFEAKEKPDQEKKEDIRGISAAVLQKALLKMNGMLTSEQIIAVDAGDKPQGQSIRASTSVKASAPKTKPIQQKDEETELDVVELMRCLKADTDDLFYICINNIPKLEKHVLEEVIKTVERSKKVKHLSLAMTGIIDTDAKKLADAIRFNEQIETLNLESNVITQKGIEALMKVVARHPTLREIKVSNQKQPFGGNGEECMAEAIDKNENILKFGYSFKNAGPRNKADRAIIRHNENLRQRRRNGEDVYDLKAACKIRDPWPQPWIRVKGQRLLGGLIKDKATEMGRMIDVDTDIGRESRGPKLRDQVAKPLDINALLSARKEKLKGTTIADLEAEQERKRKQHLADMQEQDKNLDGNGNLIKKTEAEKEQLKAKEIAQLEDEEGGGRRRRNRRLSEDEDLDSDKTRDTPPESKESKDTTPPMKNLRGTGKAIVGLSDDDDVKPIRRRKKDQDEEEGLNFDDFEVSKYEEEEEKAEPVKPEEAEEVKEELKPVDNLKDRKNKLSREGGKQIVANLDDESSLPRRRRRRRDYEENEDPALEETERETGKEKDTLKPAKKTSVTDQAKPVAKLSPNLGTGIRRKKIERGDSEEIDPFANVSQRIAKLPSPDNIRRRRRPDNEDEEKEVDIVKALEERKKQEEQERLEKEKKEKENAEKEKQRKLDEERARLSDIDARKKNLSIEGGKKVAPLSPVDDKFPRRRRQRGYEEPEEEKPDFLKLETKKVEEPKPQLTQEETVKTLPKVEHVKKDELAERKKNLSREGGVKIASLEPAGDKFPRRRRRGRSPDPEEQEIEKNETKEPKKEEPKLEEPPMKKEQVRKEEPKKTEVEKDDPKSSRMDKSLITEKSKKIASLPPPEESRPVRRRKRYDEDEESDSILESKKEEVKAVAKQVSKNEEKEESAPRRGTQTRRVDDEKEEDKLTTRRIRESRTFNTENIQPTDETPSRRTRETRRLENEEGKVEEKEQETPTRRTRQTRRIEESTPEDETSTRRGKQSRNAETEYKEENERSTRGTRETRRLETNGDVEKSTSRTRFSRTRDEKEETSLKSRRSRQTEEETANPKEETETFAARRARRNKESAASGGKWYTDEETKLGDRRAEQTQKRKESIPDIFAGRNEDDGPKLSLRERMARRGR